MKTRKRFTVGWPLFLWALWTLAGGGALSAQPVCHLVPLKTLGLGEYDLQGKPLRLDFDIQANKQIEDITIDSIAVYFYSPDCGKKGGTIRLDTMQVDKQIEFISVEEDSPLARWYRISRAFEVDDKVKLRHFSTLYLGGPEMHPTTISCGTEALAPRLLIYGKDHSGKRSFQWLSQNGDARNSGRSNAIWPQGPEQPQFRNPDKKEVAKGIAANCANVTYDQGLLEYMVYKQSSYQFIKKSVLGQQRIEGQTINGKNGFYTQKTAGGQQYLNIENKTFFWNGNSWSDLHAFTTGGANTFQAGPDGRIYVSDANFTAYSSAPTHKKIWVKGFGADKNQGCSLAALNATGDIVYVYAYSKDSLYALNAATGERLGAFYSADVTTPMIVVGLNGTVAWYTGNQINFLSHDLKKLIAQEKSPQISKPICGGPEIGNDAFLFLKEQQLQKLTVSPADGGSTSESIRKFDKAPEYPVSNILGDRSENVFFVDNGNTFYSSLSAEGWPTNLKVSQLIPGVDGNIYALDKKDAENQNCILYVIRYKDYSPDLECDSQNLAEGFFCGNRLTLKKGTVSGGGRHSLAGSTNVHIADGVTIDRGTQIIVQSAGTITFGKEFSLKQGASLECRVGF